MKGRQEGNGTGKDEKIGKTERGKDEERKGEKDRDTDGRTAEIMK